MQLAFVSPPMFIFTYNSDGFDWAPPKSPPAWDAFWV
jgi:hypothetical protein